MRSPECPRCGYDLSGKLEGYRESCPLDDVCSECGCEFRWSRVTSDRPPPGWFVEHDRRSILLTVPSTLAMLLAPLRFWRRVMMEDRPGWGRAVLIPVSAYLLCGVLTAGALGIEAFRSLRAPPRWYFATWPDGTSLAVATRIAGGLVNPLSARELGGPRYVLAIHDAVFPGGGRVIATRRSAAELLGLPPSAIASVPLAVSVFTPAVFLLPASTRKRYRVRVWHVARIGTYGLAGAIVISCIGVVYFAWSDSWGWGARSGLWYWLGPLVPVASIAVWNLLWWWSATRSYLRIERALAFAGPLVLAGLLAGFTATVVLLALVDGGDAAMSVTPGFRHLS